MAIHQSTPGLGRQYNRDHLRRPVQACVICSVEFRPKRQNVQCCTRECGWRLMVVNATNRRRLSEQKRNADREARRQRSCVVCGAEFLAHHRSLCCSPDCQKARYRQRREQAVGQIQRLCIECGAGFAVTYGQRARRLCSERCSRKHGKRLARHKGKKHRSRARIAGVAYERVSRLDVFNRDKWTCQLCGRPTPRRLLRDYRHPSAPTLDHIVPTSRGGAHISANLQCACRACNSRKGAQTVGQLRMF